MSYSFSVQADNKSAVKAKLAVEFAAVVRGQPDHAKDMLPALSAANVFVDLLLDDPNKDVRVSLNGSLAGEWVGGGLVNTLGANVTVNACLTART